MMIERRPPRVLPKIAVTNAKDGSWMWVEERQRVTWNLYCLQALTISRHPDGDQDFYVVFIGYHKPAIFECSDYGKKWRVWSERPSDTEREEAQWDD